MIRNLELLASDASLNHEMQEELGHHDKSVQNLLHLFGKEKFAEVKKRAILALLQHPNSALLNNIIATCCLKLGQTDHAIEFFGKAIEIQPNYPEALNNLSAAYREKGMLDLALQCCESAIRVNSKYVPSAQLFTKVSTSAGSIAADTVKGTLVFATNDGTASAPSLKYMEFTSDGKLPINSQTANATLDVNGNAKIGTELLLGSMTTIERNGLTPQNGMIIYNSTDNKFQGYENGAWSNLI